MPPSGQRETADKLVVAFNAMDIATIMSLRSPTCMRHLLLNIAPQDNATYEKSLHALKTVFHNFRLDVYDVIEDVNARKVVMWLSARADTAAGEYVNEYMWVLEFDDDRGEKVVEVKEFVDTVVQRDFWPRLQESMKVAAAGKD